MEKQNLNTATNEENHKDLPVGNLIHEIPWIPGTYYGLGDPMPIEIPGVFALPKEVLKKRAEDRKRAVARRAAILREKGRKAAELFDQD